MEFDLTVTASVLLSVFALVFSWFRTRRTNVDSRFAAGTARMDDHGHRLLSLEQDMKNRPDMDAIHALRLQLVEMIGSLKEMHAVMDGNQKIMVRLESIVTRHEDHLLGGGK